MIITFTVKLQLLHVAVAVDRASVNPSNINTNWQMEAESHANVLASTDPSVHAVKPKRMHNITLLQWRVIPGPPARGKRESTIPEIFFFFACSHLELSPRAGNYNSQQVCAKMFRMRNS